MKDIKFDGVGFNADWVAGFKTEKQFLSSPDLKHLFPDKDPEARTAAFQAVYTLCRPPVKTVTSPLINAKGAD
jgi:hypothetical protein